MTPEAIFTTLSHLLSGDFFGIAAKVVAGYILFLWVVLIIWVAKDAGNRSNNLFFQVVSILIVIFLTPIFGWPLYLLIRPPLLLDSAEGMVETGLLSACAACGEQVPSIANFCPYCGEKLMKKCRYCKNPMQHPWPICPHCGKRDKSVVQEEE